ncbi:MAG: SHOCT domain-containing protein [Peptococcaceae bacterium]|nr:SHOCT domain-containing protein [Peptococcaceae bacterium]
MSKDNAAPQADDVVSKLERLAALKSQGILTDEEFLDQKRKILNG